MTGVTHEDLKQDLISGGKRFDAIEGKLVEMTELLKPLPQMQTDLAATKDIVEAWSTAKNVARFIKWASGIAAGLLAIWALAKAMAKGLI